MLEFVAQHAVGHVDDELLVEALQLLLYGHVHLEIVVAPPGVQDLLDGEGLVLRYIQVLDRVALHVLLGAADEVLEKTTGGSVKRRSTY